MTPFDYSFTVKAPVSAVSRFHHDPGVLKKLMPPPLFIQIHYFEPLAESAKASFTLWFGPFPIHWEAVHTNVSPRGFTDTQTRGPLKQWQHHHRFTAVSANVARVSDHVKYEHHGGWRGLLTRLLFNPPALYLLFTGRKWLTRWHVWRAVAKSR